MLSEAVAVRLRRLLAIAQRPIGLPRAPFAGPPAPALEDAGELAQQRPYDSSDDDGHGLVVHAVPVDGRLPGPSS